MKFLCSTVLKKEKTFLFLLFWMLCFWYSLSRGVDVNWDLRNYHLYSVYALFNNRMFVDVAPAHLQTWFNPFVQIFNYFITIYLDPRIGALILSFFSALNVIIIYTLSREIINDNVNIYINKYISLIAAICAFYSPTFISLVGTTYSDNINALILLLILYISIKYKFSLKSLIVSSILFGLLISFKLTNIIFFFPFITAVLMQPNHRNIKSIFLIGLSSIIGYIPFGATWNIYLYYVFGNPTFPLMNNVFHSPFYYNVSLVDKHFITHSLLEAINILPKQALGEVAVTTERPFRDVRFLILVVLTVCLAPLFFLKRTDNQRIFKTKPIIFLWIIFVISLLFWVKLYTIQRYIVALEQLAPLLIFTLLDKIGFTKFSKVASMSIISFLILLFVVPMDWDHLPINTKKWWKADYPAELRQESVTYIFLEHEPMGYLVLSAPKNSVFIRIDGNLVEMENTGLGQLAKDKINMSKGQIRTLTREKYNASFDNILKKYNLKYSSEDCMQVKSGLESLYTCSLQKIK
ncbi:hypothetical protein [Bartonella sp. HY038]|uniref:hypothetical protein n=1 Tax=Bartonella sp. HY038 TaxID=2759660 RepID=UPI0015F7A00F|nr:hypothetical protein [Bartonella sp. HY038]